MWIVIAQLSRVDGTFKRDEKKSFFFFFFFLHNAKTKAQIS